MSDLLGDAHGLDAVVAVAHLADRAGALSFEIGYADATATTVEGADWYATAHYRQGPVRVQHHHTPEEAANALAARILTGGTCRCGRRSAVADILGGTDPGACTWRRIHTRWQPSCNAPPIRPGPGTRGDADAIRAALPPPPDDAPAPLPGQAGHGV
jgi:hypothetical protein